MARTVIARQYGGIPDLELADLPEAPLEPGRVRIAVKAAAINPADLKRLRGEFGRNEKSLPLRLGSEVSGVVIEVSADAVGPAGRISVRATSTAPGRGVTARAARIRSTANGGS